jgi:hypothetical protein
MKTESLPQCSQGPATNSMLNPIYTFLSCFYQIHSNIVTCTGFAVTYIRRVLDWMIAFINILFTHISGLQTIQRYRWYTHTTVHRCTHTRVLSLHWSYPGNGFITVSLSLQIRHVVFFAPPSSPSGPYCATTVLHLVASKSKSHCDWRSVSQ